MSQRRKNQRQARWQPDYRVSQSTPAAHTDITNLRHAPAQTPSEAISSADADSTFTPSNLDTTNPRVPDHFAWNPRMMVSCDVWSSLTLMFVSSHLLITHIGAFLSMSPIGQVQ